MNFEFAKSIVKEQGWDEGKPPAGSLEGVCADGREGMVSDAGASVAQLLQ